MGKGRDAAGSAPSGGGLGALLGQVSRPQVVPEDAGKGALVAAPAAPPSFAEQLKAMSAKELAADPAAGK